MTTSEKLRLELEQVFHMTFKDKDERATMADFTLHIPKTCTAVRVEETGGEIVVHFEFPDLQSTSTASEARATAAGLSAEERKRAANAARQKRYRDRKRNAGVTPVTQNVTPSVTQTVTRYVIEGKNESIFDVPITGDINPLNENQEKNNQETILSFIPSQKSVMRHVTRHAVTPEGQEMIPFLPAGAPPELDLIHCPKLTEALEKYFEYRAFHGAPTWFPDYEAKFWQFVQSALREFGEEKAAEIIDRNRRELRWFTLKVPPDMKLLPTSPPPEPEPEPAYDARPEISPEESEEVGRSIKEFLERLRCHRIPSAVED